MSSQTVIVFVAVLLASCATRLAPVVTARQWLLLTASYFMYAYLAGGAFLALLIASSLMNYAWGFFLRRHPTAPLLWGGIASNIVLLAFFKYLPPLGAVWPGVLSEPDIGQRILLPLGISFWTFQALSYLVDTYLEEELDPTVIEVCLYMAFWPTVASGPVCRMGKMLPQFRKLSGADAEDVSIGVVRVIQGLFMKLVLAQVLAVGVSPGGGVTAGFDATGIHRNGLDVWALAIGFGFQLFFDFAGYSHIVIGAARLFGVRLAENFDRPYCSTTPAVFWTRWHMSLSFWIRDYVYVPLAALRRNRWWPHVALVLSMVIFGFWHEAKLTMVCWGVYHGLLLVGHRLGQQLKRWMPYKGPYPGGALFSWSATYLLISVGYILFRSNDVQQASAMLRAIIAPGSYGFAHASMPSDYYALVLLVGVGYFAYAAAADLLLLWAQRRESLYTRGPARPKGTWATVTWLVLSTWDALAARQWWLLAPALGFLLLLVGLSVTKNPAIAPFAYTLF